MQNTGRFLVLLLVLPLLLAVGYCQSQRKPQKLHFYFEDELESDVWRVPIVEPHQLITAYQSVPQPGDTYCRWSFQEPGFLINFSPDSLNYQRGLITFYERELHRYGVCNLQRKTVRFFDSDAQFQEFIKVNSLSRTLFNTEQVYAGWVETHQLPWAQEILNTYRQTTSPHP